MVQPEVKTGQQGREPRHRQRPGVVMMHGMPSNARGVAGYARTLASYGAVVIAIDAPFARRSGQPVQFMAKPFELNTLLEMIGGKPN